MSKLFIFLLFMLTLRIRYVDLVDHKEYEKFGVVPVILKSILNKVGGRYII